MSPEQMIATLQQRLADRLRGEVGDLRVDLHAHAERADRLAALLVGEQHVAEGLLRRAVGLVARCRRVGEVVRYRVLALELSEHARRGDIETTLHNLDHRPSGLIL